MTNEQKRDKILNLAWSQLGVLEHPANSNKVKYNDWFYRKSGMNLMWCMTFVQWVFSHADLPLPVKTASCSVLANYAKTHNQWVTSAYKPGDIVFMHFTKNKYATEHVGIVDKVANGIVYTIEGNTGPTNQSNGGCVMQRARKLSCITGAYRPWYNM